MILSPGSAVPLPWGSWIVGLGALLGYAAATWPKQAGSRWPESAFGIGWLLHGAALALDILGLDEPSRGPRFGFGPALSVTVWLVIAVHAIESRFVPLPAVRRVLALLGAAAVLLQALYPGELRLHGGGQWMPLHWLLGIASYGLFGAAVLHALLLDAAERQLRTRPGRPLPAPTLGMPLMRLERLTYGFVEAGFVVLSIALVFGWWTTLGTGLWRWDHKTVFSLLGWATFAALIIGRRVAGWRGRRATRWLYVGAALLLLAYIGSRFVIEVLLHRGTP